MKRATWILVRQVFERALDLEDTAREAYLARACDHDVGVRREVDALLASLPAAERSLRPPEREHLRALLDEDTAFAPGTRVGAYVLQRAIASGGMATVYEALQDAPRRTVAVKMLKIGLGSADARRRFLEESEVLARLEHPAIARVLEAGVHTLPGVTGGMPYFALEYVEGARPLDRYCGEQALDLRARAALAIEVCDAVHHGHRQGVIHRDLKPANVLVDGSGRVKVIDYGIARASRPHTASLATQSGALLGTLRYMSPEQFEGDPLRVDTASDIYSLGVVLYELFCGRHPHELEDTNMAQVANAVRGQAPLAPRRARPDLPRELGWIFLRALEKEPERRYASASELGSDLRRFLDHLPIEAGPPSAGYRVTKFVRRHPRGVAAAAAGAIAALAAAIVILNMRFDARLQRLETRAALEQAQLANAQRSWTSDLFARLFRAERAPAVASGDPIEAMLDRASLELERRPHSDRLVQASVRDSLVQAYSSRTLHAAAERECRKALEDRLAVLSPDHVDVLSCGAKLARLLAELAHFEEAEELARSAHDGLARELGLDSPRSRAAAGALAAVLVGVGRYDEVLELLGEHHPPLADEAVGVDDLQDFLSLGIALQNTGRIDGAEPLFRRAVRGSARIYGEGTTPVCMMQVELGGFLNASAQFEEAAHVLAEATACLEASVGAEHVHTLLARNGLAVARAQSGDLAGAATELATILPGLRAHYGPAHPLPATVHFNSGAILIELGRLDEAEQTFTELAELLDAENGPDDLGAHEARAMIGTIELRRGHAERALEWIEPAYEATRARLGDDHPSSVGLGRRLSEVQGALDAR